VIDFYFRLVARLSLANFIQAYSSLNKKRPADPGVFCSL
jgi:hypothetical protein